MAHSHGAVSGVQLGLAIRCPHVASPCGLGFFTAWQLGSERDVPKASIVQAGIHL